ncbi:MAG: ABC transporter ATP-binding protein [Ilumatobacter sp.]|uniref:ABC transporter ATP-binding protein n=1 Tax=Ilumatobacter sp. TaxID=1967498 RepID=UPI00260B7025|nr:ABC transporter ATP-binding protein [Ilumatobacter sp.]MDJ0768217.1 ABC transporter ATP-binding protein [Ilumatobacter sp.]
MTEPLGRFSATDTIGRGLAEAPVLRQGLGVTWLFAAFGAGGRVVVPIVIQQAIDRGILGRADVRLRFVVGCAVIGVVAQLLAAICQRTAIYRLGSRAERALADLRARLVEHIHGISLADHNDEQRGALVARATSDIETLTRFFQWGGLAWLIDGTLMVIVAAVMLAYNWLLALIAIGIAVPLFFVLRTVQRHLGAAYGAARERNGEMLANVSELVTGAETIRVYRAGGLFGSRAHTAVKRRADAQIKAGIIGAFLFPLGEVFSVVTIATIVAVGVAIGPGGGLTAGSLIGFIFLTYRFLEPIAEFTEVLDQTQTAVAGLRRVIGVLDMPVGPPRPEHPMALPPGRFDIDIDDVTFAYRSRADAGFDPSTGLDQVVLDHVSAHIEAGQQVAMVGETGSGKTTLGRLIARLADPIAGTIRLGGVPLPLVDNAELRHRLVVVAQEPFLFDRSIADNVRFARPDATRGDVDEIVARLGVSDWVQALPDGLDTRVGERGESLSAGERQLVALLRAGVADPDVLVLDEATSSVDALTEVRISRALERLAAGRTTIAIAHRLSTAARADRVLVLEAGRLVEDGPHAELVRAGGTYQRLYEAWLSATTTA